MKVLDKDAQSSTSLNVGHLASNSVVECSSETTLAEAARRMHEMHCGSIIVVDAGKSVGIWTARDAIGLDLGHEAALDAPISRYMSSPVKTIRDTESIQSLTFSFEREGVRHFLVVDGFGNRIGIVSQTDVVNNQGIEFFVQMRDVQSVMRKAPLTLAATVDAATAIGMMARFHQDAVVVEGSGEYGIFTESDVIRLVGERRLDVPLGSVASFPLYTLTAQTSLYKARSQFASRQVRHLGIVDGTQLVGLLTYADILVSVEQAYVRELQEALGAQAMELISSRRSIALAQKVADSTFQGIMITNGVGELESVNPAFTAITGYSPTEVIGRNPRLLKSGRHDNDFYREMYNALGRHGVWTGEMLNRRKNGELYPAQMTVSVVRGDSGEVINYVGVFTDLTEGHKHHEEMRQVREKLEEQEDIHRLMLETLPINAFIKDASGRYLAVNNRAAEFFGFAREDLIGRSDYEIFPAEVASELRRDDGLTHSEGGTLIKEIRISHQGSERYLLVHKRAVDVRGQALLIGASVDITERKFVEKRLEDERSILTMIARGAELTETLDAICVQVARQLHGGVASFLLLDEDGVSLCRGIAPGLPPAYVSAVDGTEIAPDTTPFAAAGFTRQPVIVADLENDPRWSDFYEIAVLHDFQACWSWPILTAGNAVLGTFTVYYRSSRKPAPFELDLVDHACSLAAIAMERAKDTERLHRLATLDALTGLPNRRHFLSLAEHELARVGRSGLQLTVLMIDVDHFKKVNDTYGHAVGDIALRTIADALQRSVRTIDVVGRLGGEEFVAVLPETGEESAAHVAERLRADVADQRVAVDEMQHFSMTVSIGGAKLIPGETLTQLLSRADQLLYQAKAAGRNRVVIAASS